MRGLTSRQQRNDAFVFQFIAFLMALSSIHVFKNYEPTWIGRTGYITFPLLFVWFHFIRNYTLRPEAKVYCLAILVGFTLHILANSAEKATDFRGILFMRLLPAYMLSMVPYLRRPIHFIRCFVVFFYVVECLISVYERLEMTHVITYSDDLIEGFLNTTSQDRFRSTSLMFHPLYNANAVSIAMAFILCSPQIKVLYKWVLFALGLAALWGFNSRGVLIIWAIILLYRFTLYQAQWWKVIASLVVLYFMLPLLIDWLLVSNLLGRLGTFDLSDESTATRLIALDVFLNQRWNIEDLLIGGRVIYYPRSTISLENGVLLDLGYWGILLGSIKIICEILISFCALRHLELRAKLIIMMATWGVAIMNNNSFNTWPLAIFTLFFITFSPLEQAAERTEILPAGTASEAQDEPIALSV